MIQQLARFLVVGVLNTMVGLLVIYSAKWFFAFGDVSANALGYVIGVIVSFVLNKSYTFKHQGDVLRSAIRFVVVFLVAYSVNLTTVLLAINVAGLDTYLAQALGIPPYTLTFFVLSRFYAFRRESAAA